MGSMLKLLRDRNLALLLAGRLVSSSGDWLYTIALSIAIFQYSGGKSFYVGLLWIVRLVPLLFIGPFAGGLAGRLGYRRAMIMADVARMVVVAVLALVLTSTTWPIIYPLAFGVTVFSSLFAPASVGLIPALIDSRDDLLTANALFMQAQSIAAVIGSALGGVAASSVPIRLLLLIQAATFGISALSLFFIQSRDTEQQEVLETPRTDPEPPKELESGVGVTIRLILERPVLVFALTVMVLPEFASGAFLIWIIPYSEHTLHLGNAGIGYLYAALGIGKVAGGLIAGALGSSTRLDALLACSIAVGGIALLLFGVWPIATAALLFTVLVGAAEIVEYAAQETLLQQSVPEGIIAQASGTMDAFLFNMVLIGNALSGALAALLGVRLATGCLGTLVVIVTGLAWGYYHRQLARQPDPAVLMDIPAFAALSDTTRAWAVQRMKRERLQAGTVVFHQGEVGDKLYAITEGAMQVELGAEGGVTTHRLGPGNVFGEIALLEDIPRTATVRALESATIYALDREDFNELRARAADFGDSLLETANARLQQDASIRLALANGG